MNIDISNAHCGPRILFPDHSWLRVVYTYQTARRPRDRSASADFRRRTGAKLGGRNVGLLREVIGFGRLVRVRARAFIPAVALS